MGSVCHRYMCMLLYVQLIGCNGVAWIYAHLEEGVGLVCHRYMCILQYVKLIRCCIDVCSIGGEGGVNLP